MHLVLDAGDQTEKHHHVLVFSRILRQIDRCPVDLNQPVRSVAAVLDHARELYFILKAEFLENSVDGMHLTESAVGEDQVRHLSEFLILRMRKPSQKHFPHGSVVILSFDRLDLEKPV